jgi:hypothetical protein
VVWGWQWPQPIRHPDPVGFALAREVAYLDGKRRGSTEAEAAPVLPDGYARKAKAVAERRLVLAGYRLADLLKKTVK